MRNRQKQRRKRLWRPNARTPSDCSPQISIQAWRPRLFVVNEFRTEAEKKLRTAEAVE
jgi:hypothetical protein